MYDLIIVGGGPAGITAGIYAARKKLKTLLISKNFIGQTGMAGVIENWPGEKTILGPELIFKFKEHLDSYKIEVEEEEVLSISKKTNFEIKTKDKLFSASSVIITTGRKPKELGALNEKDFIGKGVVYCATCDAPLFQNKKVIVVGGGNAAFETAIEMTRYTKEISLFDISSEFTADELLQEKAKERGVALFNNIKIEAVEGDSFLKTVKCKDMISGEEKSIDAEGLFIQIGSLPITDFVKDLVELDSDGNIIIDFKTQETKTNGLFAAGDVTIIKDKQIIIAAGEGAKAALSVYRYLKK